MPRTYYVRASQVTPDEPREGWYVSTEHGPAGPYDSRADALDHRLTTASEMSRLYRQRAERAFDEGDVDVWERMTDAADRLAALPPSQIEPLF